MTNWVKNRNGILIPKREAGFIQPGMSMFRGKPSEGGTAPSSRYWRIYINTTQQAGSSSGYINCGLIGLNLNTRDLTNQCPIIGGTATESSVYSGVYRSINAWLNPNEDGTDNSTGYWHSSYEAPPWWTIFDCGNSNTITARELALCGTNVVSRMPTDFTVDISVDGVAWNTIKHFTSADINSWVSGVPQFFPLV